MLTTLEQTERSLGLGAPVFDQHLFYTFEGPQHCYRRLNETPMSADRETGEIRAHQCGSLTCPHCVRVKRRRMVRAVGASDPQAAITLTQASEGIETTARKMNRLRTILCSKGYRMEWVWVVECNERRQGGHHDHHVHVLTHGSLPPAWILSEVAQRVGFGTDVDIRSVTNAYGAAGYLWSTKAKWRRLDVPHRLWTNGERLHHATHKFWRFRGEPVSGGLEGVRKAIRDAA